MLMALDALLKANFEVTRGASNGPGLQGQAKYSKRVVGYTESLCSDGERRRW